MLKKLLVAVLACLTIFLSKRSMTEGQAHAPDHRPIVRASATTLGATTMASLSH